MVHVGSDRSHLFHVARSMCLAVLAALVLVPAITRAQSAQQLQGLIGESDKALQNLIAARDQTLPPALAFKRDKRGKGISDDLKENVLPPDTAKRLQGLLESAKKDLQAGDLPGVRVGLAEMRQGLTAEIQRYQAITEYWAQPISSPVVEGKARKATLQANGIESPNEKDIEALSAQLDQQIAAHDFVTAMRTTWPKLSELQNQAKSAEMQQLIAKLDSGGLTNLRSATPTRNCVPATGTSGTVVPSVRPDSPSMSDYFPPVMKRKGIKSGSPEVFVIVDTKGCAERAVLVGPSEHEEFDEAGLKAAVASRYLPAEKDGKPVRAGFYMRTDFTSF